MLRLTVRKLMALIAVLAIPMVAVRLVIQGREAAMTSGCHGQLFQYGFALMNYEASFGCFPGSYKTDFAGTPIQSWRVTMHRAWGEHSIHNLYGFTVPWTHANNVGLLGYDTPGHFWWCPCGDGRATKMTDYVAVVGNETAWPVGRGLKRSEITDDLASTILILEVAGSGTHWMEPREPTLDEVLEHGLRSHHAGFVHAYFADASVRKIRTDVSRETLRALLTVSGGETIDPATWQWNAR
jgi:Protein of unknown function (DUF1559)